MMQIIGDKTAQIVSFLLTQNEESEISSIATSAMAHHKLNKDPCL